MAYWFGVAKRAAKIAATDTKLDSLVGSAISLLSQAIIGLGLFFALGRLTDANLWTRVFSGLAPFLVFPLAFLIRLFTVPATLAEEAATRIANAEKAAVEIADRKAVRVEFAQFINEGEVLMERCRNPQDTALQEEATVWARGVEARIIALLDESYVPRFRSATGTPSNIIVGPGAAENGPLWNGLRNRVFRLQEFTREVVSPGQATPPVL